MDLNGSVEKLGEDEYLHNTSVTALTWHNVSVSVKSGRKGKNPFLLQGVSGRVGAGEMLAIMGPSGSGKTTLLNCLARRSRLNQTRGEVLVDGIDLPGSTFRNITSYVEQDDALIGSLTVRETLHFAARLSPRDPSSREELLWREELLLQRFGLLEQSHLLIGTALRKGISGGQKRRTSVAAEVITGPKILFLDEPTSGLDSAASLEVMSFLKHVAVKYNLLVVASIHQPSTSTFQLFDKLLLISKGKTCYYGDVTAAQTYFTSIGFSMPAQINPAEYLLDITNVDFAFDREAALQNLNWIQAMWLRNASDVRPYRPSYHPLLNGGPVLEQPKSIAKVTSIILHRLFIKSYRDIISYGVRIIMYVGLAFMMGTVWLRLPTHQSSVQPIINALFFGSAFMSFMAVAYVPAYLEDLQTYRKDRANGLYGPTPFLLANFIIGLPYLFSICVIFSTIAYWFINLRPDSVAFMKWIMWLFLDLLAAESLVVLVSTLFPIFVLSLAIVAFANGLWMSVGGFLVNPTILNAFWKYVFHYIDYQAYVFQGMMVNEFSDRTYDCDVVPNGSCHCMYPSTSESSCSFEGSEVLRQYGYSTGNTTKWVGIMVGIIVVYRLLGWIALYFRR